MPALTPTGFDAETFEEIVSDIDADLHAAIDPALDLSATTPVGQVNASFADRLAAAWEAIDIAYSAIDPRQAEGFLLDNIGILRGVLRNAATFGTVMLSVDLDAGASLAAGVLVAVAGEEGNQWELVEAFTTGVAGIFLLEFHAKVAGVYNAAPGTITDIVTPVLGWNSATNAAAATPGTAAESDTSYRIRQEAALATSGSGTVDAIRSAVIGVAGVLEAAVYENTEDFPQTFDGLVVGPHSFAVTIWDGPASSASNDEIAQAIWNNKPAGIFSSGDTTGTAIDKNGDPRLIRFYRVAQQGITITITVKIDPSRFTSTADAQQRIVNYMTAILGVGDDVIPLQVQACVLETSGGVPGVIDVTAYTQNGVGTTIDIPANLIAYFTTGTTSVTTTT